MLLYLSLIMLTVCSGYGLRGINRVALSSRPRTLARFSSQLAMSTVSTSTGALDRLKVKKILESTEDSIVGKDIVIKGWVRTVRDQKQFSFIAVNDGSCLTDLQAVAQSEIATYDAVKDFTTGAAVEISGTVVLSQGKGQKYEIAAKELKLVGASPAEYPLQKKRHTQEFLRTIAHLRPRTNTISAVSRVRSALAFATHAYFQNEGFVYLQSPIITASDCEGAGEMFRVTTLPIETPEKIKKTEDGKSVDFSEDFFGKPAYLTVSGQLSGETYASALGDIYTFGPTFRAENSQTTRHLAEFNMIEPEMAFADMFSAMSNAEGFVKSVVKHVMDNCNEDLEFFNKFMDKTLKDRLTKLVNEPFARIPYREAVTLLQKEIAKDPSKWAYPDVEFGTDLATEHERWLAEVHFKSCVFVHNYPKSIKAFYMRDNDNDNGETVDAFDMLVPGVGELIGGSQREERLDTLLAKMKDNDLDPEDYWWYLDLRRYGSVPHAGYGLGFERLVCYVTGIENIREAIAYPRFPGNAEF